MRNKGGKSTNRGRFKIEKPQGKPDNYRVIGREGETETERQRGEREIDPKSGKARNIQTAWHGEGYFQVLSAVALSIT